MDVNITVVGESKWVDIRRFASIMIGPSIVYDHV